MRIGANIVSGRERLRYGDSIRNAWIVFCYWFYWGLDKYKEVSFKYDRIYHRVYVLAHFYEFKHYLLDKEIKNVSNW